MQDPTAVSRAAVIAYHASPVYEPGAGDGGGMSVYVRSLAEALANKGVATDIFTRLSHPQARLTQLAPGVRVVPIEAGPVGPVPKEQLPSFLDDFRAGVRAFAMGQRIRYEVLHSHYWQSGIAGSALAADWGIPLVHSHHTLGRVKNNLLADGDRPEPQSRLDGELHVIGGANVLVASTDEECEQLACLYGASHDRLKTIHPGVEHQIFSPGAKEVARADLGLRDEAVLLYVGRIQPLKGLELAIRSLEHVVARVPRKVVLLVVGGASGVDGDRELERIKRLVAELGLEQNVRFVGPQPHSSLPVFYRAADAVVVCSHSESFGFAALEAHACGTPVVATAVGGLSFIVRDGSSGFLVPNRDPQIFAERVARLLNDEEMLARFGLQAAAAARSFSWDTAASQFLELYECLVSEEFTELCTC
jgi:D-inositol-3-phosphate glycosyltransferase